jgi:hypothetical protein
LTVAEDSGAKPAFDGTTVLARDGPRTRRHADRAKDGVDRVLDGLRQRRRVGGGHSPGDSHSGDQGSRSSGEPDGAAPAAARAGGTERGQRRILTGQLAG